MKIRYLFPAVCMVLPSIVHAETCVDFDDNMNIIEYDCSRSLADAKRDMVANPAAVAEARAKAKAEAELKKKQEAEAKAQAEALEKAVKKAEAEARAKAEAEEMARKKAEAEAKAQAKAAEKAHKKAEAEAKARAEAAEKARIAKLCSQPGHTFSDCRTIKYFVAGGPALVDIVDNKYDFTLNGFSGELGLRLESTWNNWYYTFSLMGQVVDADFYFPPKDDYYYFDVLDYSFAISPYDISSVSAHITAGMGYKFWHIFDVYGKLTLGVANMKMDGEFQSLETTTVPFGVALGMNVRLYKWLHLYGEGHLVVNHPVLQEVDWIQIHPEIKDYMVVPGTMKADAAMMLRGGVKLVF